SRLPDRPVSEDHLCITRHTARWASDAITRTTAGAWTLIWTLPAPSPCSGRPARALRQAAGVVEGGGHDHSWRGAGLGVMRKTIGCSTRDIRKTQASQWC